MSRASKSIDGIEFEEFKGRFTGTVILEDEEAQGAAMGETVVLVTVANVADVNSKLDTKTGAVTRIPVFKVTDARMIEGDLKTLLVESLGLYGSDVIDAPIRITPGERTEAQREAVAEAPQVENEAWTAPPSVVERVAEIQTELNFGDGASAGKEGPRVVPFDNFGQRDREVIESDHEIVGTVQAKDPVLASFLSVDDL